MRAAALLLPVLVAVLARSVAVQIAPDVLEKLAKPWGVWCE